MNKIIFDFNTNDILGEEVIYIIQVSAISETKRQRGRYQYLEEELLTCGLSIVLKVCKFPSV